MLLLDKPSRDMKYDAVIIGAGGGGMSLLYAMHTHGFLTDHKVLVIEPDTKVTNDRTWCFWALEDDPIVRSWQPVITRQWDNIMVDGVKKPIAPYRYYHIRSADLYKYIKELMIPYDHVHWLADRALDVDVKSGNCEVTLPNGMVRSDFVFDSRLTATQKNMLLGKDTVWQSFAGWRVRLDQPIDDDASIRLMDFNIPQGGFTQFIYVLPTDHNEALVELTRFGTEKIDPLYAEGILRPWLLSNSKSYQILEEEAGAIPMNMGLNPDTKLHPKDQRHIPIGTAAGAVKATTGYAIHVIFQHSIKLTEALMRSDNTLPTVYHEGRFNFYDRLLLYILIYLPSWGQPIFEQLFRKVSPTRVLTFLDEKTHLAQEIPLLLSLPFRPFIHALWITTFNSKDQYIGTNARSRGEYSGKMSFLGITLSITPRNFVTEPPTVSRHFGTDGKESERKSSILAFLPIIIAVVALGIHLISSEVLEIIAPAALLLGLIFPGIPHGALDHCLSPAGQLKGRSLIEFIGLYLAIMAAIIAVWYFSPLLGIISFIIYSSWHFGETDLRHWSAYSPFKSWIYGLALLLFILATHPIETTQYFQALGVTTEWFTLEGISMEVSALSLLAIIGMGLFVSRQARLSWVQTVLVLLIGVFLPLIPAFGLYFIGLHSVRGWAHLKDGLQQSSIRLMQKALPFSLGAYVMFALLLLIVVITDFDINGLIPVIFVFLAAISAPHIFLMHRFYGHST